jgi:hypothetical protein
MEARAVSTFYLLPPRPFLGERIADYLRPLFPGLDWSRSDQLDLVDAVGTAAAQHPDVYVVYREELPEGEDLTRVLMDGFGAQAGDQIIEVRPGTGLRLTTRTIDVGCVKHSADAPQP